MLKIFYSFMMSLFIFSLSIAAEKIVVIDVQKVVTTSKTGQKAQAEIEKAAQKLKSEIEKKQKSGASQSNMQTFIQEKQQELLKKRQEVAQQFMKKLQEAIKEYASKNGYTLVLDKGSTLYTKPELDKTQDFIKFFDSKYGK